MSVWFVAALPEETGSLPAEAPVVHVGVGKVQAATALAHRLAMAPQLPDLVVNLGTAGGLRGQRLGQVVEVATVSQHDFDREGASAFVGRELEGGPLHLDAPAGATARLATGDHVVTDATVRDRLATTTDLVDMEGYAVAATANRFGIPVRIVKVVSDGADDDAARDWPQTLQLCADRLASWVRDSGLRR